MLRGIVLSVASIASLACGGENTELGAPAPTPQPMIMEPSPAVDAASLADRVFFIEEARVFGLENGVLLSIGAFSGTPLHAAFRLGSTSNSDEASGQLALDPCTFEIAANGFVSSTRLTPGSKIALTCHYDPATAVLTLTDPAAGFTSKSVQCSKSEERGGGDCLAASGG
jgi:hypothetical protein